MGGTHTPAAYSNVAANTTVIIPCTIGGHTLAVLLAVFQAHLGASCLRQSWLPSCTKTSACAWPMAITLNYDVQTHTKRHTPYIYIYIL